MELDDPRSRPLSGFQGACKLGDLRPTLLGLGERQSGEQSPGNGVSALGGSLDELRRAGG